MIRVTRTGGWTTYEAEGPTYDKAFEGLVEHYAYPVEGAEFSEAYRRGSWDGKARLLRLKRPRPPKKAGGLLLSAPGGLDDEIVGLLTRVFGPDAVEVRDERPDVPVVGDYAWAGPELRSYQRVAASRVLVNGGGILRLPIRSGKTITAARVICEAKQRALFVVTSDLLAEQAHRVLAGVIASGGPVAQFRGGAAVLRDLAEPEWSIVVATIQALAAHYGTRAFEAFSRSFGTVVLDEVHHLSDADVWRKVALGLKARIKVGLSATVAAPGGPKPTLGDVWLRGVCGPVVASVAMGDLMRAGHLLRPVVQVLEVPLPDAPKKAPWSEVYRIGIVENSPRNDAIVKMALGLRWAGVFIDCSQVRHARALRMAMLRGGPGWEPLRDRDVCLLVGATSSDDRRAALERFRAAFYDPTCPHPPILLGTILGEGVDIPELGVMINAGGGSGFAPCIQRLRNLTPSPAKAVRSPIVVDFMDASGTRGVHPLSAASMSRLGVYRSEGFPISTIARPALALDPPGASRAPMRPI